MAFAFRLSRHSSSIALASVKSSAAFSRCGRASSSACCNRAAASRFHALEDVLKEKHLGRAGLVVKLRLRLLAFLAAERRIHQQDIEELRRAFEQIAVNLLPGERVAVPDVRFVHAVQNEI